MADEIDLYAFNGDDDFYKDLEDDTVEQQDQSSSKTDGKTTTATATRATSAGTTGAAGKKLDKSQQHFGLLIHDLTWYTSDKDLITIATDAGVVQELNPVELTFLEHKGNGKSKGSAYMQFKSESAAQAVFDLLSKIEIHGHKPRVEFSEANLKFNPYRILPKDSKSDQQQSGQQNLHLHHRGSTGSAGSGSGGGPLRSNYSGGNRNQPYGRGRQQHHYQRNQQHHQQQPQQQFHHQNYYNQQQYAMMGGMMGMMPGMIPQYQQYQQQQGQYQQRYQQHHQRGGKK